MARRLDGGREDLERDAALDHPRHVDVAPVPAHEEVAAEQQRVGVQVDGAQGRVERQRPLRRGLARLGDRAQAAFDPADEPVEDGAGQRQPGRGRRACRDRDLRAPARHAPKARPRVGRIQTGTL